MIICILTFCLLLDNVLLYLCAYKCKHNFQKCEREYCHCLRGKVTNFFWWSCANFKKHFTCNWTILNPSFISTTTPQNQSGSGVTTQKAGQIWDSFWDLSWIQWTVSAETHQYQSFMDPYNSVHLVCSLSCLGSSFIPNPPKTAWNWWPSCYDPLPML